MGRDTRFGHGRDPATQLVHGQRSAAYRLALVRQYDAALSAKRAALEADCGDALSTVRTDAITRYLETDLMLSTLAGQLKADGIFTSRGRVRSAFGAFVALLDRWQRLAVLVGVERRSRPVPDLATYLATRYGERVTQAASDASSAADGLTADLDSASAPAANQRGDTGTGNGGDQ